MYYFPIYFLWYIFEHQKMISYNFSLNIEKESIFLKIIFMTLLNIKKNTINGLLNQFKLRYYIILVNKMVGYSSDKLF